MADDARAAAALGAQAQALEEAGDTEGAIRAYADAVDRFGSSTDPEAIHTVAKAMHNMGLLLSLVGRRDEAIRTFDRLIERFGNSFDPELQGVARSAEVGRMLAEGSADDAVHDGRPEQETDPPEALGVGFLEEAVRRGGDGYAPCEVTRNLSASELGQLVFFLLDVFLFVAGIDEQIDEKERRVLDRQLRTATTYPEGLHRDLMWLLGAVRDAQAPDGDWLAALDRAGQAMRGGSPRSLLDGVPRKAPAPVEPGASELQASLGRSADVLQGLVEERSSGAILMPGGDVVYQPASFPPAKALLKKILADEDYKFFMDRLLVSAVDVITDCWTLGEESITLEDNAVLGWLTAAFEIDMEGLQDRADRFAHH